MSLPVLAVVGTGPVGCAVARGYSDAGGRVEVVVSRDPARATAIAQACGAGRGAREPAEALAADFVLVAVPDRVIASVGRALGSGSALVCHTSGALPATALGPSSPRVASLHPLQSFPAPPAGMPLERAAGRLASRLPGAHWFHEGAGQDVAREVVAALGGVFHALAPGGKALYHAGAAVLSNHTVALFAMALELFEAAGVAREDAQAPLAALLAGTSRNLAEVGVPVALTGPVARGDVTTVEAHLEALDGAAPHLRTAYVSMALRAVDVALAKASIDAPTAGRLRALLAAR